MSWRPALKLYNISSIIQYVLPSAVLYQGIQAMIQCSSCGQKYADHASFCNPCAIELNHFTSISLKEINPDKSRTRLFHKKTQLIQIHRLLAALQIIALVVILYGNLMNNEAVSLFLVGILAIGPLLHFYTATGIIKNSSWAHSASMIIGILYLFLFPIGTLAGGVILANLFNYTWDGVE